jgi:hypothetical protein
MDRSTELGDGTLPQAAAPTGAGSLARAWGKLRLAVRRTVFWAYERGSWQYDLLVLAILAFIFLSPRAWFHDRPTLQLTDLRHQQGFVEMGHGREGWRYLVDARLVESVESSTPEDAIRTILSRRLTAPFAIKAIVPIRDKNNVVLGYTVMVDRPGR